MKGRGTLDNPGNRFERIHLVADPDHADESVREDWEPDGTSVRTAFFKDASRTVLAKNDSPDLGFGLSLNPYRGCEHGCVYCYARPTHEYLGLSAGLDFETKIFVKTDAARLLAKELSAKKYAPETVFFSGVTDCYQPVERKLEITRQCLEVLVAFSNPVWIVTKNALVTRDIDLLSSLAKVRGCGVAISLTTLDNGLCAKLEPRTSRPSARLAAVRALAEAGIPVGVNVAPIIPALNEVEIPAILKAAANAGAQFACYTCVRLPYGVKDLFANWLETHFPERKQRVLSHIRQTRGGALNSSEFGTRLSGDGVFAERIGQLFRVHRKKNGLDQPIPALSTAAFKRPVGAASGQISMDL